MDSWKVALLGDSGVGKTTLATQFTIQWYFDTYYDPDAQLVDDYRKQFVVDNNMCYIEVKDTAQSGPRSQDERVGECQGFILVYSIASRATFDRVEVFRQSMQRITQGDPVFMLVGNKCDKSYEREVSMEEGEALARQFGCGFIETSAKTARNVERLFMTLVRAMRERRRKEAEQPVLPKKQKKSKCIIM